MDNNNASWKTGLLYDSRTKIVNRIMDTLQRHMPPSGQENMNELLKIAWRFEEKIFHAAVDQQDYLRKISLKMLSLETKASGGPINDTLARPLNNQVVNSLDTAPSLLMSNQAQSMGNGVPFPGQVAGLGQQRQQMAFQNNFNPSVMQTMGMGAGASIMSGLSQGPLTASTGQNIAFTAQKLAMQREQQQQQRLPQHQQQQQSQQQGSVNQQHSQLIYQQRLHQQQQQHLMKQKMQQQSLQQQQQQQSFQQQVAPQQQPHQSPAQMLSQNGNVQTPQQQQFVQGRLMHQKQQQIQQQQQQVQQQQAAGFFSQSQQLQQPQQLTPSLQLAQQPQQPQQLPSSGQQLGHQTQQQRLQQPGALSQQQPLLYDIQQQQNQRVFPDSSIAAVDSPSHAGAQGLDPRELVWPKLQELKDKYLQDMKELYQMLTMKSNMPMPPEQLQKLKHYKDVLHRMIPYLTVSKEKVPPEFNRDKVDAFEKQILNIMDIFKRRRPSHQSAVQPQQQLPPNQASQQSLHQQVQLSQPQQQQLLSQVQQQNTNQGQQMQLAGSEHPAPSALHSNNMSSIPQNGGAALQQPGLPTLQQTSVNAAQPHATALQANSVNPLQQGGVSSQQANGLSTMQQNGAVNLQKSNVNPSQQTVANSFQSQGLHSLQASGPGTHQPSVVNNIQQANGVNKLQQQLGANTVPPNSANAHLQPGTNASQQNGMLQHQQQLYHAQQQQQLQKEQELAQQNLAQRQLKQQQNFQQQHQQQQDMLQQQQKIPPPALHHHTQPNQSQQSSAFSGSDALKAKQTAANQVLLQQQMKQRRIYEHQRQQQQQQQLKVGSPQMNSQLVSSPQNFQAPSPQISISQQMSPQTDLQNFVTPPLQVSKVGTPAQATTVPLRTPSPSLLPVTSPLILDEIDAKTGTPNIATSGSLQTVQFAMPNDLTGVGTPGPSVSPAMADFTQSPAAMGVFQDVMQAFSPGTPLLDKANVDPVERLVSKVFSLPATALSSAVGEMNAIISCHDKLASSAPGPGARTALGEDLALSTKTKLHSRLLVSQDSVSPVKKKLRRIDSVPHSLVSVDGSVVNSLHTAEGFDQLETGSRIMSSLGSSRLKVPLSVQDEIRQINGCLVGTKVEVNERGTEEAAAQGKEGVVVTCNYNTVAVSSGFFPNNSFCFPSVFLLIPPSYPASSPIFLPEYMPPNDSFPVASAAGEQFVREVRCLSSPFSLEETAKVWDKCAHSALAEAATLHGGGTFSTSIGVWDRSLIA